MSALSAPLPEHHPPLPAALPSVAAHAATPAFGTRGLQPFHDFASGPDWWNYQDYKVGQSGMAHDGVQAAAVADEGGRLRALLSSLSPPRSHGQHVLHQLTKMQMNFIGLHTYPYSSQQVRGVTWSCAGGASRG